ncbi:hypothetical protein GCM10020221_14340 [Streptomyces thioluteus]|uniref:Uncharacterized protein n=1 Tax=Streptomyces thioluteus TaxID=66431 RepID=A0ABN3WM37_STRTU
MLGVGVLHHVGEGFLDDAVDGQIDAVLHGGRVEPVVPDVHVDRQPVLGGHALGAGGDHLGQAQVPQGHGAHVGDDAAQDAGLFVERAGRLLHGRAESARVPLHAGRVEPAPGQGEELEHLVVQFTGEQSGMVLLPLHQRPGGALAEHHLHLLPGGDRECQGHCQ